MERRKSGLSAYMITGGGDDATLAARVERALSLGVDLVQLRVKSASAKRLDDLIAQIVRIRPAARKRILVNDRFDVALSAEVLGVHLPLSGLPIRSVVGASPPGFVVGCSTHSRAEAEAAARAGASFIVFGPLFETESKPGHPGLGVESLAEVVAAVDVPVFALGGMRAEHVGDVARAGARGVAGISVFEREETLQDLMTRLEEAGREARA